MSVTTMRLDWRTAGAGGSRRGVPDDVVLVRVKALLAGHIRSDRIRIEGVVSNRFECAGRADSRGGDRVYGGNRGRFVGSKDPDKALLNMAATHFASKLPNP